MLNRLMTSVAAAGAVIATVLVAAPGNSAPENGEPQQILVDLGERTGEFRGAASGSLYGLSDEGVPSESTMEPLRIDNVNQKPPAGAQHPNGDALTVSDMFFRAGGEYIQINVQDMYAEWTYENIGGEIPCNHACFDDYMEKLAWVVDEVSAHEYADRFVYVPFNEPDFIWYGLSAGDPAEYEERMSVFLDHWKTAVEYIRDNHEDARVMGMNDALFRERNMADFLSFGLENDVLPDMTSWHQLDTTSLDPESDFYFRDTFATYRAVEAELGIDELPVNINEYGGNRDLTVPGQLVQWVAMLEEAKVDAGGKAYWTVAGSLAGDVVQTNRPGAGWWFYKMYADMHGGESAEVTRPDTSSIDALDAFAVVDDERRQARIVAGGTGDEFDIVVHGIDQATFGDTVNVRLSATTWSGQDGDAPPPTVLDSGDHELSGGALTVPVRGLGVAGDGGPNVDRMAAYEVVITPGGEGTGTVPAERAWRGAYEAENATITSGQVNTHGTPENWNAAAASGTQDVGALTEEDSAVAFDVDVPAAGDYRLSILYGNQADAPSQQVLTVNGENPRFVDYDATLHWQYRAREDVVVALEQGDNEIRLAASDPELGRASGQATIDRIDLELIENEEPVTRIYEAELAQSSGRVSHRYDHDEQSGPGHVVLRSGAETTFVVFAEDDGYHDLEFRYSALGRPGSEAAQISLDRTPVDGAVLTAAPGQPFWDTSTERFFLLAGVNRITVEHTANAPLRLDSVEATMVDAPSGLVRVVEAENADLAGAAVVEEDANASGGAYVGQVGQGSENRVTVDIEVEQAGDYTLVVHYSNNERDEGHPYNADIISRPLDIEVNGSAPERHWFKNTWSWGNWWARGVPISLEAGANSIALYNDPELSDTAEGCPQPCMPTLDSEWAPDLDKIEIAPVSAGG